MTFSIAGRCARTGMLGVAVTTSSIAVGARCPWARAGVGAVVTQNITDPALGPILLDIMADGIDPETAIKQVHATRESIEYRQIIVIDCDGNTASFAGAHTLGTNAIADRTDCISAGNLLADERVPAAMVEEFGGAGDLHLGERLMRALEAGEAAGGEKGPVHSAALLVVDDQSWPLVDLRVDWDDATTLKRLRELWQAYESEMAAYVVRAVDPASAPAYGVPGDP